MIHFVLGGSKTYFVALRNSKKTGHSFRACGNSILFYFFIFYFLGSSAGVCLPSQRISCTFLCVVFLCFKMEKKCEAGNNLPRESNYYWLSVLCLLIISAALCERQVQKLQLTSNFWFEVRAKIPI